MLWDKRKQEPIKLPGFELHTNEELKIAILYDQDTSMPEERYAYLEEWLLARGYFLQVVVGNGLNVETQHASSETQ